MHSNTNERVITHTKFAITQMRNESVITRNIRVLTKEQGEIPLNEGIIMRNTDKSM